MAYLTSSAQTVSAYPLMVVTFIWQTWLGAIGRPLSSLWDLAGQVRLTHCCGGSNGVQRVYWVVVQTLGGHSWLIAGAGLRVGHP